MVIHYWSSWWFTWLAQTKCTIQFTVLHIWVPWHGIIAIKTWLKLSRTITGRKNIFLSQLAQQLWTTWIRFDSAKQTWNLCPVSITKTRLLIWHPNEEFGTVPFSFDSDSLLQIWDQRSRNRLVYQYLGEHAIGATGGWPPRLFQCQGLTQCPNVMITYRNHRNSKKCSF